MEDQSKESQDIFAQLIAGSPGLRKLFEPDAEVEKKNPRTRCFRNAMTYRYYASHVTTEGVKVQCCYSCWKNVAGFYLAWVERRGTDGRGSRKQYTAHKTRSAARACAERWARDLDPNYKKGK